MAKAKDDWEDVSVDMNDWEEVPVDKPTEVDSVLRGARQGATLGFADELAGAGGALGNLLGKQGVDKVEATHPELQSKLDEIERRGTITEGDAYRKARDEERRLDQLSSETNPAAFLGGEIAGGVANPAGRAASTLPGALGLGAVTGLGGSDSDLTKDSVAPAIKDTALGAAFGGAGYGVAKAIPKLWEGVKYFGKKGLTNLGPSEEAINARLAGKAQDSAKSYSQLAEDFAGTARKLGKETKQLSDEAGAVLSKEKAIPRDAITAPLDMELEKLLIDGKSVGKTDKQVVSALNELKEDFAGLGDQLSEADIKRVIKKMDDNINWEDQSQNKLNTLLEQVRFQMDDVLKSRNPTYKEAMAPVAERAGLLNDLRRQFNLKKIPGEGLQPTDTTATKIQTSLRDNKAVTQGNLEQLAGLTGEDYQALAKDYQLAQQFEKTGAQGSRRAVTGGALGGALGTAIAPGIGTAVGTGLGTAVGATMDRYGGKVAGALIDSYLKAGNSAVFGKFRPMIEAAEKRGPAALATLGSMLSTNPEFRELMMLDDPALNAAVGKGLDFADNNLKKDDLIRRAVRGDQEARFALAEDSLGMAMGSLKDVSGPVKAVAERMAKRGNKLKFVNESKPEEGLIEFVDPKNPNTNVAGESLGSEYDWWLNQGVSEAEHNLPFNNVAALENVSVDPSLQGRGIGHELVKQFEKEAKSQGHDGIVLNASPMGVGSEMRDPNALEKLIKFYKSLGYKEYGPREDQNQLMIKALKKQ